ncbi:MAG: hypothetical protein B6D62_03085 [Candidatus Cloacimonas sp. 4484_275]|nr:MAG: hypothetical protein B6D62_03085 [Candidatus Cloacimonas sp. 4484_275]
MEIKNNCKYFRGDIPCIFHKKYQVHCDDCNYFEPIKEKILIIKLGAAGDVIRTTPVLRKLREVFPDAEITWLTQYPIFVPQKYVNNILAWNLENILWLQSRRFDFLFNLDKDREALGLANIISARTKKGFLPDDFGKCAPADNNAEHKWLTGIYDDVSRQNKKSYPEEIFEIFGFSYNREKYILELPPAKPEFDLPDTEKIIGLNTGCGTRWLTRLWGEKNWIELSNMLSEKGFIPLLLGGPVEDEMNRKIAQNSPACYLGTFKIEDFLHLVNRCSAVVTSVTMAMHIALALEKKLVLLNNIFNKNEFELFGLGKILEPEGKNCLGCYRNTCPKECMSTISPQLVFDTIQELLKG